MHILDAIPFTLDPVALLTQMHLASDSAEAAEFLTLLSQARAVAKPKVLIKEAFVDARGPDTVTIGGITFTSRTLRANLATVERVFAYVATCGAEVDRLPLPEGDFLRQFWLDAIKASLLGAARTYFGDFLTRRYALGKTASMNPGSGDATVWPIEQQRPLFALLGDTEKLIGVRLTLSYLMLPNKTVSGLRFTTEADFRACQLCHREVCPNRSAPFDPALYEAIGPAAAR